MTSAGCAFAWGRKPASGARWMAASAPTNQQPPRPASSGGLAISPEPEDLDVEGPRHVLAAGRHRQLDVIDTDDLDHGLGFVSSSVSPFGVFGLRRLLGRRRCRLGRLRRLRRPSGPAAARASPRSRPSTPRCPGPAHGSKSDSSGSWAGRSVLRDVDEVDPDAVPDGGPAAHPVDQDVGRLEVLGRRRRGAPSSARGPPAPPSLNSARAISTTGIDVLRRPVGVGFEPTHSVGRPAFGSPAATAAARSAATSGGGPPASPRPGSYSDVGRRACRRLDPRRLAGLLGVVRRPRGVAQALGLVARAQLEQRLERPDRVVDAGARVADRGEPRRHGVDRERLGLDGRRPRPRSAASRRARRAAAGPSRREATVRSLAFWL